MTDVPTLAHTAWTWITETASPSVTFSAVLGGAMLLLLVREHAVAFGWLAAFAICAAGVVAARHILSAMDVGRSGIVSLYFPSGHVAGSVIAYGGIALLIHHALSSRQPVGAHGVALVVAAVITMIGMSRIVLGAHTATEVFGGAVWGAICLVPLFRATRQRAPSASVFYASAMALVAAGVCFLGWHESADAALRSWTALN